MSKMLEEHLWGILSGHHTIQKVPKLVWMRHSLCRKDIIKFKWSWLNLIRDLNWIQARLCIKNIQMWLVLIKSLMYYQLYQLVMSIELRFGLFKVLLDKVYICKKIDFASLFNLCNFDTSLKFCVCYHEEYKENIDLPTNAYLIKLLYII